MLAIELIETAADCTNVGACCFGCPMFDQCAQCAQHDEED